MPYRQSKEWRKKNREKHNAHKRRNYAKGALHDTNSCLPWTVKDTQLIMAKDRPCDRVLAKKLGRSVQAIQVRRSKVKNKLLE